MWHWGRKEGEDQCEERSITKSRRRGEYRNNNKKELGLSGLVTLPSKVIIEGKIEGRIEMTGR